MRSSILPCPRYWVAIGYAVVCNARAAHAFSAFKCPHCTVSIWGNKCGFGLRLEILLLSLFCHIKTASTVQTFKPCSSRPDVSQCLVVLTPMDNMDEMTNVACDSKLRSVVRSSEHPCPEYWGAIWFEVEYYARAHLVQELMHIHCIFI